MACAALCSAQISRPITLDESIALARKQSVDAAVALNELRSAYYTYRTYRAELLPEISFDATLPSYRKSYSAYQMSDGVYTFVRNNNLQMTGELSVSQNIWLTGGSLSLNTSLDFLKQLDHEGDRRYMSVPIALTLNQPLFGTNTIKWDRRIEPVRYEESLRQFLSASEDVAMTAINYFFDLLLAKENMHIAEQNLNNATKLYAVAQAKREMGQISKNDVLQLELNQLNAQSDFTAAQSNYKSSMFKMRAFLDIDEQIELDPQLPGSVPDVLMDYSSAIERAHANNYFSQNIRRRQLEAEYAVAKAKGQLREVNLYAQVGFTGTSTNFRDAYDPLKDNQIVQIGFSIPILDWGRRRGNVKVAESNRMTVESRLRKEQMDFDQDIFILVERFNNQRGQVAISQRADTIAATRYDTNVETFMIGRLSTLDLNDSQVSKDESRQAYINQLYLYWMYYYQLRSLTLWDFAENRPIEADIRELVK